ncbi:MAG: glycosyltransferase family 39 protein [Acidobacteriota bacterium]
MRILALIILAGAVHRLLFLGRPQLWTDELMQAFAGRPSSFAEVLDRVTAGLSVPAPLDIFVQNGVVTLLGESNFALRLHAAVFGILSIWIFFRIADTLFGRRVALYSTCLFAFFPLQYRYSQEGQPYALLLFLTLLSYDLLLKKVLGRDGGWPDWLYLGVLLTLILYTSLLGFLVVISQVLGLVLLRRPPTPDQGIAGPGGGTPDLPGPRTAVLLGYALAALVAICLFVPWLRFAWSSPVPAEHSEIADPWLVLRIVRELGGHSYVVSALLLAGAAAGFRALRLHGRRRTRYWLLAWLLPSLPLLLIVQYWSGYFFSIRQVLHVTPALVLLAGYGLSYVGERMRILDRLPYQFSAPAIAYAALLVAASLWIGARHWSKEHADWRGTAQFLADTIRPGDALVIPEVYNLLEYYQPVLRGPLVPSLDAGALDAPGGGPERRIVVCYDWLRPDPCADFRPVAMADDAWQRQERRGFTIFLR